MYEIIQCSICGYTTRSKYTIMNEQGISKPLCRNCFYESLSKNKEDRANRGGLMSDVVNHPEHYISDSGIETIDVIEAFTKDINDPFAAYCTGNIIKYICRWPNKNGVEDLKKARWYLDKLIEREDPVGESTIKYQQEYLKKMMKTDRTNNTDHNEEA